jgi:hypothetical protein
MKDAAENESVHERRMRLAVEATFWSAAMATAEAEIKAAQVRHRYASRMHLAARDEQDAPSSEGEPRRKKAKTTNPKAKSGGKGKGKARESDMEE